MSDLTNTDEFSWLDDELKQILIKHLRGNIKPGIDPARALMEDLQNYHTKAQLEMLERLQTNIATWQTVDNSSDWNGALRIANEVVQTEIDKLRGSDE